MTSFPANKKLDNIETVHDISIVTISIDIVVPYHHGYPAVKTAILIFNKLLNFHVI